ncbi:MAG: ABC transporter ATP-binding protein [Flavobacteriaceae bacterium]
MQYFIKIIHFARPFWGYAVVNVICNLFYALFSALALVSFIPMLDVLFNQPIKQEQPPNYEGLANLKEYIQGTINQELSQRVESDPGSALIWVIGLILTLFLLKNMFNYLALFAISFLRNGVLRDLRNALYNKILHLPLGYFTEKRKGDLMARMASDVIEVQVSFLSVLELLIREPLTILLSLWIMFQLSSQLTLFVLLFIPVSGFVISSIGKQLRKKSEIVQKEQGYFMSLIDETLNGQKIIKIFNAKGFFNSRFQEATRRFYLYSNSLLHRNNLASPLSEFMGIAIIGVLLWYGGNMVLVAGSLKGTTFFAYMGLAYNILTPAKGISKSLFSIRKGDAAAERLIALLETPSTVKEAKKPIAHNTLEREIIFDNISFSYGEQPVLKDFNLRLKRGEMVALVGQSGSGKTTIANLLNRFYDVGTGQLLIDGFPITQYRFESLYEMMGMVTQEAILFNDTVANNIRMGKQDATDAELIEAAKVANAHEFICKMEQGYNSSIGEGGNKLSGGQKQRLSIARAILKNPDILILDEATSALDTESEKLVQQALEQLMHNRTSLVIAHRLSTIQKADKIVVLKEGEIIETGTHQSLLKQKGAYYQLVKLQQL